MSNKKKPNGSYVKIKQLRRLLLESDARFHFSKVMFQVLAERFREEFSTDEEFAVVMEEVSKKVNKFIEDMNIEQG